MKNEESGIIVQSTPSFSIIKIGNQQFIMKEMTIGRVKDFAILFSVALDQIKDIAGVDDLSELEINSAIGLYADKLGEEIQKLWNFVFEFKNDGYEAVSTEWVLDNLTPGRLVEVVRELMKLSRLDWLGPFLKSRLLTAAGTTMAQSSASMNLTTS